MTHRYVMSWFSWGNVETDGWVNGEMDGQIFSIWACPAERRRALLGIIIGMAYGVECIQHHTLLAIMKNVFDLVTLTFDLDLQTRPRSTSTWPTWFYKNGRMCVLCVWLYNFLRGPFAHYLFIRKRVPKSDFISSCRTMTPTPCKTLTF